MAAFQQNGVALKYIKTQLSPSQNSSPSKDDICPICQDDESTDTKWCEVNNCKHKFHKKCMDEWLKVQKTCPMCRSSLI